jgi:hypothetical protein
MGAKVSGISQAKSNLDKFISSVQGKKAARAILSALLIGGAQAALYTPIDTSFLLNSQFRELVVNGNRITGRVGYSANYAALVHDPSRTQNFRRSTAKKEFLTKGFDESRSQIDAVILREMSL